MLWTSRFFWFVKKQSWGHSEKEVICEALQANKSDLHLVSLFHVLARRRSSRHQASPDPFGLDMPETHTLSEGILGHQRPWVHSVVFPGSPYRHGARCIRFCTEETLECVLHVARRTHEEWGRFIMTITVPRMPFAFSSGTLCSSACKSATTAASLRGKTPPQKHAFPGKTTCLPSS